MIRFLQTAAVAFALTAPLPASAQALVDATDPGRLAEVITGHGYRAALEKTQAGNPIIRSAAEGVNFDVFFYGCKDGADCQSVRFVASFRLPEPPAIDVMNTWNATKTIGMAYVADNGSARLGHFLALRGGVSDENFRAAFDLWRIALRQYVDHIGFRR